jgi:hypothetical protein
METFKEFYDLVKTFWIDVYHAARKGTETHLKAIKIFLLFCVAVFVILAGIFQGLQSPPPSAVSAIR